jgi:hypothetical protein
MRSQERDPSMESRDAAKALAEGQCAANRRFARN